MLLLYAYPHKHKTFTPGIYIKIYLYTYTLCALIYEGIFFCVCLLEIRCIRTEGFISVRDFPLKVIKIKQISGNVLL